MSMKTIEDYPRIPWAKALTNNSTRDASFVDAVPGAIPAAVDASGDPTANKAVVALTGKELQVLPFGTDADNETFNMRITLWSKVPGTVDLWIPHFIGGFVCTLSIALNGITDAALGVTAAFADTITEEATNTWDDAEAPLGVRVRSHPNDHLALIRVDTKGYELATIEFDLGTAATANALYRCL